MSKIVHVPFHGDTLQAVQEGERVYIAIRRVCDALGLDFSSQLAKLRGRPWATVVMITTVAEDGRDREVACIDLDSLPMWLVTIDAGRVAPEAREKIVLFQCQATAVLRDYFVRRAPPPPAGAMVVTREELSAIIRVELERHETHRDAFHGVIGRHGGEFICSGIREVARLRLLAGTAKRIYVKKDTWRDPTVRSARMQTSNDLREAIGMPLGFGGWNFLPESKRGLATIELNSMKREANAVIAARDADRQVSLYDLLKSRKNDGEAA